MSWKEKFQIFLLKNFKCMLKIIIDITKTFIDIIFIAHEKFLENMHFLKSKVKNLPLSIYKYKNCNLLYSW